MGFLSRGSYSLDIETTGLDPEEHQITTVGLCENGGGGCEAEMWFVDSPEDEVGVFGVVGWSG